MENDVINNHEIIYKANSFLSYSWTEIFCDIVKNNINGSNDYYECLHYTYSFNPLIDYIMSINSSLFNARKAAAMYFWYKKGDPYDNSIIKYFDEYEHCINEEHKCFNSNYGIYAFSNRQLDLCIKRLTKDPNTRQAMFCINNNSAMSDKSIDKLCTNTVQFFIRNNTLDAIIQMRSSNFITLLPYDAFMFSVFYAYVYNALAQKKKFSTLNSGNIFMQVASLHFYKKDFDNIKYKKTALFNFMKDIKCKDFIKNLEMRLNCFL